jgi:hypothetical protein
MSQPIIPSKEYIEATSATLPQGRQTAPSATAFAETAEPTFQVHEGEKVYTADDHKLGTVKEVTSRHFKVHRALSKDYWLDTSLVSEEDGESIRLAVSKGELDDVKMDTPSTGDALLDTEEQLRQRRAMESELGVQSDGLRIHQDDDGTRDATTPEVPYADRNRPMPELGTAERGPIPGREPNAFDADSSIEQSRGSSTYVEARSEAVPNPGPLTREGFDTPAQTGQFGSDRRGSLEQYAQHLRQELSYVERELGRHDG